MFRVSIGFVRHVRSRSNFTRRLNCTRGYSDISGRIRGWSAAARNVTDSSAANCIGITLGTPGKTVRSPPLFAPSNWSTRGWRRRWWGRRRRRKGGGGWKGKVDGGGGERRREKGRKGIVREFRAWSKRGDGEGGKPINFTMANSETVATPFLQFTEVIKV